MNIFGGNTGVTYEQLQQRRKLADQLRAQNTRTPQNVGEGIHAIARALVSRGVDKQNTAKTEELRKQYEGMFSGLMGGGYGGGQAGASFNPAASMPSTPPDPNDPAVIGADTMAALGEGSRGPVSADVVRAGLVKRGLPEHVADAFVLNFQDESGLNPNINEISPTVPGSRGGFGLAQWTGPRRVALEQFAKQTGRPINSVDTQLDFLMTELQGPESKAANAILSTRGTPDAAAAVVNQFLRPAEEHRARREAQYTGSVRTAQAGGISPSIAQLAQILSAPDEFVPPGQKAIAQALLQQQIAAGTPMSPLEQAQLAKIQAETAKMQTPEARDPIEVGGVLLDPNTYQPIYDSREPPKDPTSVQEYKFYEQQAIERGETPLPYDGWVKAKAEAGRAQTNVVNNVSTGNPNAPGADEEALRKKLGEGEGTLWSTYLEQGGVSAGTSADMELLNELIQYAPQGPLQGRLAQAFPGFNSAADAFQSVVKRVAPTLRAPGSGSTSDVEYDGMLKSLPQLSARPEANSAIAAMMQAKAQINIERAQVVQAFQNGEITSVDARKKIQELDKRSIMTPELQAIIRATSGAPGEGSGQTGTRLRFNPETGELE